MSTVKYKATERYQFGWSDPRMAHIGTQGFGEVPMVSDHFSRGMTADQLKAAWLIVFGSRPVTFMELRTAEDPDIFYIGQELYRRMMLLEQKDFTAFTNIYVLKDKLNASN